ncbi:hypothetical protein TEA_007762 [Camellia sinensis var. sinensis]|uniref:DM2 domain-containing protein n=1 Tax=Camellia sinensis var. sinensis TaxID=542762 RepID=A0A4S4DXN6_CAMSN|nr:hypothetical protein TEA_007762 [Camellia sinensis var. sinensis]
MKTIKKYCDGGIKFRRDAAIVDFCCGANDFSCLMKKKLDETGKKKCSYKNYDILQPKNDFNFEERDWMSVKLKELPPGSQLIMGLNPPFGVNAALANKFIDKALEFKPKLLILIVPKETERLDKKGYDLIWENNELLAGKSFYLPGSVDINDNQLEDWNVSTPPLYLWSHPDWTAKHKAIAQRQGHLAREQKQSHLEVHDKPLVPDHPMKDHEPNGQTSVALDDHPVQNEVHEQLQERQASVSESHKEGLPRGNGGREVHEQIQERRASVSESHKEDLPRGNGGREVHENRNHGQNRFNRDSKKKKKKHGGKKNGKGFGQTPQKTKERGRSSPASKMYDRVPRCSPPNSSRPLEVLKEGDRHFDQSVDGSRSHYRTGYEGSPADDIARRYGLNSEGPYSGPGPDYGVRNPEGQFGGYQRESTESRVYRPYVSGIEDTYARESAMRSQAGLYGQQGPNTADPSYNRMSTTSTMERYAPRLDEMNHTRMNTLAGEPPRNGIADPLAQQRGYRVDTLGLGFVPGPYRPSSQHNTSGWLNE